MMPKGYGEGQLSLSARSFPLRFSESVWEHRLVSGGRVVEVTDGMAGLEED